MKARFELALVGVVGPKCIVESAGEHNELVRVTPPAGEPFDITYNDLFSLLRSLPQPDPMFDQVPPFMGGFDFVGAPVPNRRRPR